MATVTVRLTRRQAEWLKLDASEHADVVVNRSDARTWRAISLAMARALGEPAPRTPAPTEGG